MSKWPMVPIGSLLTKSEDWVTPEPDQKYNEVTVRLWGKGVVPRGKVSGSEIAGGRRLQVRANQFILSRIDARNGAIGLVPESLDGALVTNDFPIYHLNNARVIPSFLDWMSKTSAFVELCKRASEGTTNRVRLKEDRFLSTAIPLPPPSEQRRIVARIESLAAKVGEARGSRAETTKEAAAILASGRRALIGIQPASDWIPLSRHVAEIENGKSPATDGRPAARDEWGVLKVGAVSFGLFDESENKALPPSYMPPPNLEVRVGDFLMSRANTQELVGACAYVRKTRSKLMLSDKTFRFVFQHPQAVLPGYLEHLLKSPPLRYQIERQASGTSPTMKNISKEKVLTLQIPNHQISEQRRIVTYLDGLQAKVDALKKLQAETAVELAALLPSILDKAFKGEL